MGTGTKGAAVMGTAIAKGGAVYSLRFNASEVETLKSLSDLHAMKITEVIKEAIRVLATGRREEPINKTLWSGSAMASLTPASPPQSMTIVTR